ncbi:hypothetical protein Tco_0119609, partial [Tanacetum coccineum]
MVQAQAEIGEGSPNPTDPHHTLTIIQPSTSQPQRKQRPNEAVNEEMDDSLKRAATTTTSLDAEQDRGNITKTQSKATPNEPSSLGTSSGGSPRRQETMGTDKAKITRKWSKLDKHEHGNGRARKKPRGSYQ